MSFPNLITASQMRKADAFTMEHLPITSIELMEKASEAFVDTILNELDRDDHIMIFCGCGNNGGDGFAVSRILQQKGFKVSTYLVQFKDELSPDCNTNFKQITNVEILSSSSEFPELAETDIIIDALFGYGFKGEVKGWVAELIQHINEYEKIVFAIDTPSGLESEGIAKGAVIKATKTISFQRPKLSFLLPENATYVGNWEAIDIGLMESYIQEMDSSIRLLDENTQDLLHPRKRQSHKGTYGHALMIAGSYGKMGAAVLSTSATLRGGAGLVTSYIPKCGYNIMQTTVPEAMCITDCLEEILTTPIDVGAFSAIGIGPGIGKDKQTKKVLKEILRSSKPTVIDADALNLISEDEKLKKLLHPGCVITPHIKEFDRIVGASKNSLKRFEKQRRLVEEFECVVVLKDAYTSIISPVTGKQYLNTSGCAGMATGGSGDVLTGLITGLLAQGYSPIDASLIGVYFHGIAGQAAAELEGENSMTASDILNYIKL